MRQPERQRSAQKEATRQRVVKRALRVCERRGFLQARTADVARAAGLSHGAVFVHFPTREALLSEVASELGRKIADRMHALAAESRSLREVLAAHLAALSESEALYRHLVIESPLLPKELRSGWIGIQSAVSHHICRVAEREIAGGTVRRMPVHLLFNTWLGLVHHSIVNRDLFAPDLSVFEVHGADLVEHFLHLISSG